MNEATEMSDWSHGLAPIEGQSSLSGPRFAYQQNQGVGLEASYQR